MIWLAATIRASTLPGHHEGLTKNSLEVLMLHTGDLRELRDLQSMVAQRQLHCAAVHFRWPILTRWSGKLCIHILLRVSLILLIMRMNEVTDVCCMCHIFACLLSVMWLLLIFVLKVRRRVGFHSTFTVSILAHSSICAPPSSGLSIHVGDLNACLLISLCAVFKRAFSSRWRS
jgi:hypothetical protein